MSLLTLVRGDGEKPFDVSAIEDHGGTKMKTNGADLPRILRSLLHKDVMVGHTLHGSLFLRERRLTFASNINRPACNTEAMLSQYKLKRSKISVISILYVCVYLGCTTANYEIPLMTRAYGPVGHVLSVS